MLATWEMRTQVQVCRTCSRVWQYIILNGNRTPLCESCGDEREVFYEHEQKNGELEWENQTDAALLLFKGTINHPRWRVAKIMEEKK